MVFFIDEARSRPPPRLLTNVNKKMVFFIEGFPKANLLHVTFTIVGHLSLGFHNKRNSCFVKLSSNIDQAELEPVLSCATQHHPVLSLECNNQLISENLFSK